MLAIRFMRTGRRNRAFFRIVLTESSRPPKSNCIKELGWFDPHTKQTSLHEEEILKYLNTGAKPSNSVAKLLLENKMKHKQIVYKPDAPKQKRGKGDQEKTKTQEPTAETEPTEDNTHESAKEEEVAQTEEETPQENEEKAQEAKVETKEEDKTAENEDQKES
ncbi:MAG: 30S ribosomal protein S16 [candidate division WS2 bacterium ADurb.Bin280]|uniref:Small ribosomal subunit protein bS16 n=1 Tax=candidate division WS2 bacterium ADurb.Bin280 TaxID=1852829 RepID=A0A1V5SGB0_9BACT|nr:MAG: 30S ribosomal protein S16 [candidate division WS2 bacterium ADurb.Bin280]